MSENIEPIVHRVASALLPTEYGDFTIYIYTDTHSQEYAVLVKGEVIQGDILVRLHSECLTGDVFHSLRCDCRPQLELALRKIQESGSGIIVYLPQEGRGIGLTNKIRAYALQQESGLDTVEANIELGLATDNRQYAGAADILHDLGVGRVRLMTNNPLKVAGLQAAGIAVVEQISAETTPTEQNRQYLATKKKKLGHRIENI